MKYLNRLKCQWHYNRFKYFNWNLFHHFSLSQSGIFDSIVEVRFMQELDHQYFFMQVFKMSCCEGRLEANILTNKCIIWGGLEPRSLAWIESVLQSKSTPDQHQAPGISTRQGVKLENSSGILNIHETFFEHFVHYFIF